jgi:hypothetical protein
MSWDGLRELGPLCSCVTCWWRSQPLGKMATGRSAHFRLSRAHISAELSCISNFQRSNMISEPHTGYSWRFDNSGNEDEASAYGGALSLGKDRKPPAPKHALLDNIDTLMYRICPPESTRGKRRKVEQSPEKLLACPFAKRYCGAITHHSCHARGWDNLARVK